MTDVISMGGEPLKTFSVTYSVQQHYVVVVPAQTANAAEHLVKARLDEERDVLDGSTRVHHDHIVFWAKEVRS